MRRFRFRDPVPFSRRRPLGRAAMLCASLALAGCAGGEPATSPGDEAIDTAPLTIEAAQAELAKIDRRMASEGDTPGLKAAARAIRDQMEVLDGLVDRLELDANHTLSFIMGDDGSIVMAEHRLQGTPSAVAGASESTTIADLYARFAPGRAVPSALAQVRPIAAAEAPQAATQSKAGGGAPASTLIAPASGDTDVVRSALTGSAADANYFRDHYCPTTGVFPFCMLNWSGGGWATATSDHSFVSLAPYSGAAVGLEIQRSGSIRATYSVLKGDIGSFWYAGPKKSVTDSGCCWICACGTHYEATQITHEWNVVNASGKSFHFGGHFYNNPLIWNGP